ECFAALERPLQWATPVVRTGRGVASGLRRRTMASSLSTATSSHWGQLVLSRRLPEMHDLKCNVTVQQVLTTIKARRVCLNDRSGSNEIVVDAAILAIPAPITLGMLANPEAALGKMQAEYVRQVRYVSNMTLALAFRKELESQAYGILIPSTLEQP